MTSQPSVLSAAGPRRRQRLQTIALALVLGAALCGCVYRGAKITEGTDLAVGLSVPGTDGALQLNALNWLSGFRLGVARDAALTVEYATAETNDYLGVVSTRTAKRVKATVTPVRKEEEP